MKSRFFLMQIHGTYRQKDRLYTEDTFYGTGKKLTEATTEEIEQDMRERVNENPLAYDGTLKYALDDDEIAKLASDSRP